MLIGYNVKRKKKNNRKNDKNKFFGKKLSFKILSWSIIYSNQIFILSIKPKSNELYTINIASSKHFLRMSVNILYVYISEGITNICTYAITLENVCKAFCFYSF